ADVIKAKGTSTAEITEQQAEAEAEGVKDKELATAAGIEAKGLAEARGIEEKAKAMKLLQAASQQHEEFRLKLAKERDVDLAALNVQRDIAKAHSTVVGEALKHANIDIVGGENDFFEKIVRSVGNGKSVDRLLENSRALRDVKNTFFTGDREQLKSQLQQWARDFNVRSEDIKNLTVAALLAKFMASTDDNVLKSLLESARGMVQEAGLADLKASVLLEDKKPAKA
ncbi:MAG: flotillin family protein, partial [Verrucomicrobiae bacterium]|nr:flotillin family protein [Verrucomicrobiae bacterium]